VGYVGYPTRNFFEYYLYFSSAILRHLTLKHRTVTRHEEEKPSSARKVRWRTNKRGTKHE
jgi:hypothetical protein